MTVCPSQDKMWGESWTLFGTAICCFLFSMSGEFVFDDSEAILNNPDVNGITPLSDLFRNDFWGTRLSRNSSHKSFRPLAVLAFRLMKQANGGQLSPRVFHSTNVLVHGLVTVLLYRVLGQLLASCRSFTHLGVEPTSGDWRTSFYVSLLFAVHPVHCENVCAAVGLADLLSALFVLLAISVYIKWDSGTNSESVVNSSGAVFFGGIAMLLKEQGITVLGICCAFDCICWFNNLRRVSSKESVFPRHLIIIKSVILTVGCLSLLWLRLFLMGYRAPEFHTVDNPASFISSRLLRFFNFSYVYTLNVWILIHPLWLCFDWSMGCIPLIKSLTDYRIMAVLVFWLALMAICYFALYHNDTNLRSRLQLSLVLCVVPFIPASNLFFRVGFVVAERALYLSSIGYFMLIVTGLELVRKSLKNNGKVIEFSFYLICLLLAARCVQRSLDWRDEKALFASGLNVCPLNAKVHYNIAKIAADSGDKETAISEYRQAIALNPEYFHAMNNLANILKDVDNHVEAEGLLKRAVEIRTDFAAAWMNLGIVQTSLKKYSQAEKSYLSAIRNRLKYADCMYNLGNLYLEQERFEEAFLAWRNSTLVKPQLIAAWNNLIVILDNRGDYERAIKTAEDALKIHPNDSSLHFNYGNVLGKLKRFEEAEVRFKRALLLSEEAVYYANLGVLYHRWKRYDEARAAYLSALKLNPNMESTKDNLNSLLKIIH